MSSQNTNEANYDLMVNRLRLLSVLFEEMGNLVLALGKEEQTSGQGDFLKQLSHEPTQIMTQFSNALTATELGTLIKLLVKLTAHTNNLGKFQELTPEHKIVVGTDLKELTKSTKDLIASIKGRQTTNESH